MDGLEKVTFEPHDSEFCKVKAEYDNGESELLYLDVTSAKIFLRQALGQSTMYNAMNR